MIKIVLSTDTIELWDSAKEEFIQIPPTTLELEHSLVSLSSWESKWKKPFITKEEKTKEEIFDYIKCMTINEVDPNCYHLLKDDDYTIIDNYINDSMTATWFTDQNKGEQRSKQITAELIYYWMIAMNIPVEFEHWHLNRLMTLIRICNIENQPPKKMSKAEIYSRNKALNEANRRKFKSKG